ncbi:hypothetical protein BJ986_002114 [Phycicoccus badiiscoriae]|uniref:Uncharacterized protein n=1 Tax=Pedococcus badiiscoriae TaxID=642776 RepID=A0A852WEG4_9MICO|nr:hypothetical protein [Pedococcus badiiscoriae]NYG07627.1 hypothetical protein [Pedococcus badiiscoriae]
MVSALPGWLVVAGGGLTTWLDDKASWSAVPFGVGAAAAVAILRLGDRVVDEDPRPDEKGHVPWLSEVASATRLSRAYLSRWAETAGLPQGPMVTAVWAPWWLMLGFWVFLVLNAIFQFTTGG